MTRKNDGAIAARDIIDHILTGRLGHRAQGFLLSLPQGYALDGVMREALLAAYGAEAHPDVRVLAPEGAGNLITVEKMRDALPFLASSPAGAGMKTLIILQAHRMNDNAANALLKPLEEPTRHTRIILLTDRPGELLVTIRSRCSNHLVAPDPEVAMQEVLHALGDEAPKGPGPLRDALRLADANPALAAQMIRHKLVAWIKKLDAWLDGDDPTPPLPTLTGKTGAPLSAVAQALQAALVLRCRDHFSEDGSNEKATDAAWAVMVGLDDIDRAGIDAKTRLHTLLVGARRALR